MVVEGRSGGGRSGGYLFSQTSHRDLIVLPGANSVEPETFLAIGNSWFGSIAIQIG